MNSRFTPATNLKIGTFVLIPNFVMQKGISKKLQPIQKGQFQINDKPTDVTYNFFDSNEKESIQHRNNLLPYYPKEYALREPIQLYSFTGFKIVHNNSDNSQKQTIDTNCSPQLLEKKYSKNTRQNSREKKNKQTHQNQGKNQKLEENFLPQDINETSHHRQSSRLRKQPRKAYKTCIPQFKIL